MLNPLAILVILVSKEDVPMQTATLEEVQAHLPEMLDRLTKEYRRSGHSPVAAEDAEAVLPMHR